MNSSNKIQAKTCGYFDYWSSKSKKRILARLAEPASIGIYRYGALKPENAPIVTLVLDGMVVQENNIPSKLDPASSIQVDGKSLDLQSTYAGPSPGGGANNLGEYTNSNFDPFPLIKKTWSLSTKEGTPAKDCVTTLIELEEPVTVRVHFLSARLKNGENSEGIFCRVYVDGALLKDMDGSLLFPGALGNEGNSIDVTGKSVSVGFHEAMKQNLQGKMSGLFYLREVDIKEPVRIKLDLPADGQGVDNPYIGTVAKNTRKVIFTYNPPPSMDGIELRVDAPCEVYAGGRPIEIIPGVLTVFPLGIGEEVVIVAGPEPVPWEISAPIDDQALG